MFIVKVVNATTSACLYRARCSELLECKIKISTTFLNSQYPIIICSNNYEYVIARIDDCWTSQHDQNYGYRLYNMVKNGKNINLHL